MTRHFQVHVSTLTERHPVTVLAITDWSHSSLHMTKHEAVELLQALAKAMDCKVSRAECVA